MAEEEGSKVWDGILAVALRFPWARVDRAEFLKTALSKHVSEETLAEALETTPAKAGVPLSLIQRAAHSSIRWHRAGVVAASTAMSLPGGWWVAGAAPADLTQYLVHTLVIAQKLAYLHGWPELSDLEEEVDDETKLILTLFVGVMFGAEKAGAGVRELATALSKQVVKRLPRKALTKYAVYQIAKQVAKWLGVQLTKKKFAELLGRAIPIAGGIMAGTITWVSYGRGAKRLRSHLETLPLATGARAADA